MEANQDMKGSKQRKNKRRRECVIFNMDGRYIDWKKDATLLTTQKEDSKKRDTGAMA